MTAWPSRSPPLWAARRSELVHPARHSCACRRDPTGVTLAKGIPGRSGPLRSDAVRYLGNLHDPDPGTSAPGGGATCRGPAGNRMSPWTGRRCRHLGGVERGDDGRIATSVLWEGAARSQRLGGSGLHLGIDLLVAAVPTLHLRRSFRAFLDLGQHISDGTTHGGEHRSEPKPFLCGHFLTLSHDECLETTLLRRAPLLRCSDEHRSFSIGYRALTAR